MSTPKPMSEKGMSHFHHNIDFTEIFWKYDVLSYSEYRHHQFRYPAFYCKGHEVLQITFLANIITLKLRTPDFSKKFGIPLIIRVPGDTRSSQWQFEKPVIRQKPTSAAFLTRNAFLQSKQNSCSIYRPIVKTVISQTGNIGFSKVRSLSYYRNTLVTIILS